MKILKTYMCINDKEIDRKQESVKRINEKLIEDFNNLPFLEEMV